MVQHFDWIPLPQPDLLEGLPLEEQRKLIAGELEWVLERADQFPTVAGTVDSDEIKALQEGLVPGWYFTAAQPVNTFIANHIVRIIKWVYENDPLFRPLKPVDVEPLDYDGLRQLYKVLRYKRCFLESKELHYKVMGQVLDAIAAEFQPSVDRLVTRDSEGKPTVIGWVNMYDLIPDARKSIDNIYRIFSRGIQYSALFTSLAIQLERNFSHITMQERKDKFGKFAVIAASDSALSLKETVEEYLRRTPFLELFQAKLPLIIPRELRFEHTHILGRTGSGKTTLIEAMFATDFMDSKGVPSQVLITPHGDIIRKWRNIPGAETAIITIDPRDIEYPPAINPFAINQERMASYSAADQEKVTNGVITTFDYIFAGLGLEFTPKQRTLWRYLVRLLLSFPRSMGRNATVIDLLHLLQTPDKYVEAIDQLPEVQRNFFYQSVLDPKNKNFNETREQIANRIHDVVSDPNMERLLTAPETKLDFYTLLQTGHTILIDTADDFLGSSGSRLFGGMMLSLIFQAIQEREVIPEEERHPTFIYVDEAATYFTDDIEELLTKVRKYKCGCTFAHHYLGQASDDLRSALVGQTSTKFAAPSEEDARVMAREMRTTPEFLTNLPKHHFGAFIRGVTHHAVAVKPLYGVTWKPLSHAATQVALWKNRERTSFGTRKSEPRTTITPALDQKPEDDKEFSTEY